MIVTDGAMDPVDSSWILIVDDEPGLVRLLERALRKGGFANVQGTTDPRDFLERFRAGAFDLVMLDLTMPELSGHEVLEELSKVIPPEEFVPRVVLSGEMDPEPRRQALKAGATEFLTKPVDLIELVLRVRNLLTTRRLHQALQAEKRSLEMRVAQRTEELRQAHEELVARLKRQLEAQRQAAELEEELHQALKVEALGQLAGSVAHDFNNLLSVIMNFAEFAAEEIGSDHPAAPDVAEIRDAARSGSALTRQLLMFSRREATKPEILEPDAVIAEMEPLLSAALTGRQRLQLELGATEVHTRIDKGHLEQILMNLIVNARDAMDQTGVVTLATSRHQSDAFEHQGEDSATGYVCVAVADTGTGMPAEVKERIFEPFFTTKQPGQGTGLGLATTQRVVAGAGGFLRVDSEPGDGTIFRIYLPVTTEAPVATAVTSGVRQARGEVIVAVTADDGLRRAIARTLESNGYRAYTTASATEALTGPLANGAAADLLLTDVVPEGMSGIELARRAGVKVLFMSGYAGHILEKGDILEPGALLLPKPFTPQVLLDYIGRALDQSPG